MISGSRNHTARVWDTSAGRYQSTLSDDEGKLEAFRLSSDGSKVLTGSENCGTVRVWDIGTIERMLQCTLEGHLDTTKSAEPTPDALHIVSYSPDSTMMIRDAITSEIQYSVAPHVKSPDFYGYDYETSSLDGLHITWFSPGSKNAIGVEDASSRIPQHEKSHDDPRYVVHLPPIMVISLCAQRRLVISPPSIH
jgi:WD40 repeat protein